MLSSAGNKCVSVILCERRPLSRSSYKIETRLLMVLSEAATPASPITQQRRRHPFQTPCGTNRPTPKFEMHLFELRRGWKDGVVFRCSERPIVYMLCVLWVGRLAGVLHLAFIICRSAQQRGQARKCFLDCDSPGAMRVCQGEMCPRIAHTGSMQQTPSHPHCN
jgi:hypothetical protein